MTRVRRVHVRGRGARAVAVLAVAVVGLVVAAPAVFAGTATSPSGTVMVSVQDPVQATVASGYVLKFTNSTSEMVSGVVAKASLPAGMTLRASSGCASVATQTGAFQCTMANLSPGATENATFGLVESSAGTVDIPFTVSGSEPVAGSPGTVKSVGDSVTLAVNVQPGPTDVQVTGSASNGGPAVGSTFSYTFQVKNNGPLAASGVTFDDALAPMLPLGSVLTISNGSCTANFAANSVHCDIGALGVGQQSVISFSAKATQSGSIANQGSVAMIGSDTRPDNNSAVVFVQPK